MKKLKTWSMMTLAAMMLPLLVSCGGDSNDDGDGGYGIAYTVEEIANILKGTWNVFGNTEYNNYDRNETFVNSYKGTIKFGGSDYQSVKFDLTEGKKYEYTYTYTDPTTGTQTTDTFSRYIEKSLFDGTYNKYSIVKMNGKNYLVIGSPEQPWYFEIQRLNKNSFKLVIDQDINYDGIKLGHIYMTMES